MHSIMYSPTRGAACISSGAGNSSSLCSVGMQISGFAIDKINPSTVEISQGIQPILT